MTTATPVKFDSVLARVATDQPGRVYLTWSAPNQGARVVQVLIDDVLYAVSSDPTQRAMWIDLDPTRPHRIELSAVADDEHAWSHVANGHALVRDHSGRIGTRVRVTVGDGALWEAPLFGAGNDRPGFGAVFGEGGFGYDLSIGPGLGRGALGLGPLGADGDGLRIATDLLGPGVHELDAVLLTPDGQASEPIAITLENPTTTSPPQTLNASPDGTLRWS